MDQTGLLRNYGIVPQRQAEVKESVRSVLTPANVFGQWAAFVLFVANAFQSLWRPRTRFLDSADDCRVTDGILSP